MAIGLGLILVIRPLAAWLVLGGSSCATRASALVIAFYGIRGIGSIYYVAYATSHVELADKGSLWATVAFTIVASTVIHGFTAGFAVERATQGEDTEQREKRADCVG